MGFSAQKYWSGLPCPPRGNFPDPGIEPTSHVSVLVGRFFTNSTAWEAHSLGILTLYPYSGGKDHYCTCDKGH